ncbi:MAG: hypothetical protein ACQEP6_01700 [Patescibacteria group bacterium]
MNSGFFYPKKGEVWSLKRGLVDLPENLYILVVEVHDSTPSVRGVKIFTDREYKGPDDYDLGELGVAETWNCFPVAIEDMGDRCGVVNDPDVFEDIWYRSRVPSFNLIKSIPVFEFRKKEIDITSEIALIALEKVLPLEPEGDSFVEIRE